MFDKIKYKSLNKIVFNNLVNKMEPFFYISSLDWDSALIEYSLPEMSFVQISGNNLFSPICSQEESTVGRIELKPLIPDTEYKINIEWKKGVEKLKFRTLPKPNGKLKMSFAITADLHISKKLENRKGRLFIESYSILRDMVEEWNKLEMSYVLICGDITNKGEKEEYELVLKALKELKCPFFVTPGDHDINNGYELWNNYFGKQKWIEKIKNFLICEIDTSSYKLSDEGKKRIEKLLEVNSEFIFIISHLQLIPDNYICFGKNKLIQDYEKFKEIIENLTKKNSIIYVGHQNVPSKVQKGKLTQINIPQPVQFPCGWVLVRIYEDKIYHTYMPIKSPVLNDYSRKESNLSAIHYKESQWEQNYRIGNLLNSTNFFIEYKKE